MKTNKSPVRTSVLLSCELDLGRIGSTTQGVDPVDVSLHGIVLCHALLAVVSIPLGLPGHVEKSSGTV